MEQLILHLLGDYIFQSHWMATWKTKSNFPCFIHVTLYSLPFLFITHWYTVLLIGISHFIIDRFRLAKYICKWKNYICPTDYWTIYNDSIVETTGYPNCTPDWMATWLLILCDNTLHLLSNYLMIKFI